jgi:hypothetical protein
MQKAYYKSIDFLYNMLLENNTQNRVKKPYKIDDYSNYKQI